MLELFCLEKNDSCKRKGYVAKKDILVCILILEPPQTH